MDFTDPSGDNMTNSDEVIGRINQHFEKEYQLRHAVRLAEWDQSLHVKAASLAARTQSVATLNALRRDNLVELMESCDLPAAFRCAATRDQSCLREVDRYLRCHLTVPAELQDRKTRATARAESLWADCRSRNDWESYAPALSAVVEVIRLEAQHRAEATGLELYDSLLDIHEPGLRIAQLKPAFEELKVWAIDILSKSKPASRAAAQRRLLTIDDKEKLFLNISCVFGFDLTRGRIDFGEHPFCAGVPEDTRLILKKDSSILDGLLEVIHETGHACYEQNLPTSPRGHPINLPRSVGVHESQSLFFENMIGRHPAFLTYLSRTLSDKHQFPISADELNFYYNQTRLGLIRIEADEISYILHIILRVELELKLINGEIEVSDLPEYWNILSIDYLGLSPGNDFRLGCMQDIHWSLGLFGYFPCYVLGQVYAAHLFHQFTATHQDYSSDFCNGNIRPAFDWLKEHIWSRGSYDEVLSVFMSSEKALDTTFLRHLLENRYKT